MKITKVDTIDVRFPTSRTLVGSDAMNPDPDYSTAYAIIRTDGHYDGHGFAFTIGRGNDVAVKAIEALARGLVGLDARDAFADMGAFARLLTHDSQFRWLGPEKGVIHLATAALINAMWDLYGKVRGKPVWRILVELSPAQIADLVDWRYLSDALTRDEAIDLLERAAPGRSERTAFLLENGYPAYTTSPGWAGFDDDLVAELCRKAVRDGFRQIKLKVGIDIENDVRRLKLVREVVGPDIRIAVDANQCWDVEEAIETIRRLTPFDLAWVEEPTSPDDVLGHAAIARAIDPVPVAMGEHAHNRVMFKQFLSAGAMGICQIDACRVGGVNENVAILLLAAKFGVPVCPHAGGVGLCEAVQHLAMFDFIGVSGSMNGRFIEYIDHLHEHFVDPAVVTEGRYRPPVKAGYSTEMKPASLVTFSYPKGDEWTKQ